MSSFFDTLNHSLLPIESADRSCPLCNAPHVNRTKRRFMDRMVSLATPVRRYRCVACGWEGNLRVNR